MADWLMNSPTGTGVVDLVLAVTVVEALGLAWHHRATGRGVAPREFALNMASGVCLMGALRCVAGGAGLPWAAVFLVAAGVCHVADMARRWQGRAAVPVRLAGKGIR